MVPVKVLSQHLRGPFAKFVDWPYHSKSELCEGAVSVFFSKYLPRQSMHFLQRSTHFSKTWCRPLITRSSRFMVEKAQKSHGARYELNSVCGLDKVDRYNPIRTFDIQSRSRPMRLLGFSNHETGAPRQEISKRSTVCSTFSRSGWSVVRSASLGKEGASKKRPSPHLHKVSTRSNKVSPWNLQTALICGGTEENVKIDNIQPDIRPSTDKRSVFH
jgi:hypothetical protein